jgi:hypothetical protein
VKPLKYFTICWITFAGLAAGAGPAPDRSSRIRSDLRDIERANQIITTDLKKIAQDRAAGNIKRANRDNLDLKKARRDKIQAKKHLRRDRDLAPG